MTKNNLTPLTCKSEFKYKLENSSYHSKINFVSALETNIKNIVQTKKYKNRKNFA